LRSKATLPSCGRPPSGTRIFKRSCRRSGLHLTDKDHRLCLVHARSPGRN
jgi:hypothetical protein